MTRSSGKALSPKRRLKTLIATFMIASACLHDALAIPILNVDPPLKSTMPSEVFSVGIEVTEISDLFAFQFGIQFDPLILNATAVTEGDFLSSGGTTFFVPGFIDNQAGLITFNANTLSGPVPGINGSGRLMNVEFLASGVGTSSISILLDPLNADGLLDSALNPIDGVGVENGRVVIGAVSIPEPATVMLIGLGLIGFVVRRKKTN